MKFALASLLAAAAAASAAQHHNHGIPHTHHDDYDHDGYKDDYTPIKSLHHGDDYVKKDGHSGFGKLQYYDDSDSDVYPDSLSGTDYSDNDYDDHKHGYDAPKCSRKDGSCKLGYGKGHGVFSKGHGHARGHGYGYGRDLYHGHAKGHSHSHSHRLRNFLHKGHGKGHGHGYRGKGRRYGYDYGKHDGYS